MTVYNEGEGNQRDKVTDCHSESTFYLSDNFSNSLVLRTLTFLFQVC